jgi:hypothetical protein
MRRHHVISHRVRSQKSQNRPNPTGTAGTPRHGAASAIRWLPARSNHAVPPRRRVGTLGLVVALVISVLTVVGGKSAVAVVGGTTPAYLPAYNVEINTPDPKGKDVCTGSLVSRRWVLTAAHCVHHLYNDWFTGVLKVGALIPLSSYSLYLGGSVDGADTGPVYHVDQVQEEPVALSSLGQIFNDVALLHMTRDAPDYLAPVPLAFSSATTPQGAGVVAVGWGGTDTQQPGVILQQTIPGDFTLDHNCFSSGEVCYRRTPQNSSDIAGGDSGGPWLTTIHGSDIAVGLTSGHYNNTTYGLGTYEYRYWIRKYVPLAHVAAGTIARDQDSGKAYLVDSEGFRRSIVDPDTYNCLVNSGVPVQNMDRYALLSMPQNYDSNATCDSNVGDGTGDESGAGGGVSAPAQTTTTLTSSVNPSVYGQPVTFTAAVDAPGGTVYFSADGGYIGAVDLGSDGTASISSVLTAGTHTVTAYYGGIDGYTDSSDSLTQTVDKAHTTTSVASTANPAVYCQTVRFSSTVSPVAPGAGTPTGQITLADNGSTLGTASLDGNASGYVDTQFFAIGHHPMTMSYGGDGNFYDSQSTTLDQVVNKAPTITTLTPSPSSSNLFGHTSTFTAAVTVPPPACGTPTGQVTFDIDGTVVASSNLDATSETSFSTTALTPGTHTVTASYVGDDHFLSSAGGSSYTITCTRTITGTVSTNITASGESTCLMGARVTGSVTVPSGTRFAAMNSTISGAVVAIKTPNQTFLCGTKVGGSIDVDYAKELVMVGDRAALCTPNTTNGSLILRYNTHGVEAIGNTVAQLVVTSNSGPGPYGQQTTIAQNVLKASK